MLAETREEVEEKAEEEEEESNVVTSGTNRAEKKKRSLVIPYIRNLNLHISNPRTQSDSYYCV